ncbi:general odorant-binding protein 56a-like [Cotesia typhae]|uniref:general odorant-binding protein 56a-like n=1 Tax=Cotesia typhae TaxID=2053667 RepID=UPI003D69325F
MKSYTVIYLAVSLAVLAFADAKSVQKRECPFKKYFEANAPKCMDKISEENLGRMMQGNMDNDEIKCFVGCVFESAGFMKDNKIQLPKAREAIDVFVDEYKKPQDIGDKLYGVVSDCAPEAEKGANNCEIAANLIICFKTNNKYT